MSADAKTLQAMLTLLANAGITPDDLQAAASQADSGAVSTVPTVAQFVPQVAEVTSPTTRRTYGTYWKLMVAMIGTLGLDQVKPIDIARVAATARDKSVQRRNGRGGVGAQENAISAMRVIFRHAVANKLVGESPALAVPKPRRKKSTRRGLSDDEVFQVWEVVASGGDDPELDALLLRFFLETGARRGGALGLRLRDVNTDRQQVRLFEKGDTQRWQPISATLLDALLAHAHHRGARDPDESVFRYRAKAGVAVGRP
ncbi:tyrosine-type recombinase/integrase [Paractinoplanes durhamensis]